LSRIGGGSRGEGAGFPTSGFVSYSCHEKKKKGKGEGTRVKTFLIVIAVARRKNRAIILILGADLFNFLTRSGGGRKRERKKGGPGFSLISQRKKKE